ncbi:MAG: hypothetical protein ACOYU3_09750 [Bacillota bacterium]
MWGDKIKPAAYAAGLMKNWRGRAFDHRTDHVAAPVPNTGLHSKSALRRPRMHMGIQEQNNETNPGIDAAGNFTLE